MCCGNRTVVARNVAASTKWVVVHKDGSETSKNSEVAAKLAAALSPGSRIEQR